MSNKVKQFKKNILRGTRVEQFPAECLFTTANTVKNFSSIVDLKEALRKANIVEGGIGVAAPQINVSKRVFYYNVPDEKTPVTFNRGLVINPEIKLRGELVPFKEGCLSMPGYFWNVFRPEFVWMEWIDQDGTECGQQFDGLMARLIQHEYDHLEGRLIIDYLNEDDYEAFEEAWFEQEITGSAVGGPIYVDAV